MRSLVLALLVACAPVPRGPTAIVRLVTPGEWSHGELVSVGDGLAAWRAVGISTAVEAVTQLRPCPNSWAAQGLTDCALVIGLKREHGMMQTHRVRAMSDRATDTVIVDASLTGDELAHVIAHEVGHILLNTAKHTTHGVMVSGGWLWDLTAADRALACETIGRSCK